MFDSIHDSIQSTFGGNICVSLGAAEAAPVHRAFVYILDHPKKCSLDTHRSLAMQEATTQESSSEVRLLTSGSKDPSVHSESNFTEWQRRIFGRQTWMARK